MNNNAAERPLNGDVEDDDEDDGGGLEAWERTYAEDRSWEALQEDESGNLRPIDNTAIYHAQYRRRLRTLAATAATARIQKGLIRYLYVIIDFSKVFYYSFCVCVCVFMSSEPYRMEQCFDYFKIGFLLEDHGSNTL